MTPAGRAYGQSVYSVLKHGAERCPARLCFYIVCDEVLVTEDYVGIPVVDLLKRYLCILCAVIKAGLYGYIAYIGYLKISATKDLSISVTVAWFKE